MKRIPTLARRRAIVQSIGGIGAMIAIGVIVAAGLGSVTDLATAQGLGSQLPPKSDDHVLQNPAYDDRQGGDTIGTSTVIPSLPYSDTGATCGYVDDYDEVCPYSGSTSPDVVYRYTVTEATSLSIDLCGSGYDTKLYVYDHSLNVLACNDDYYFDDVCGVYVSALFDVYIPACRTVYIVIDGYGGDCGEYTMEVTSEAYVPCVVECPTGADHENEPPLHDGYLDSWNGGCNSPDFGNPFQYLYGHYSGHLEFCGNGGWYDESFRDTDWFIAFFEDSGSGVIDWWIDAEQGTYLFELFPQDCGSVAVAQLVQVINGCNPVTMTVFGAPGDPVWMWVGADAFAPPPGFTGYEYDYLLIGDGTQGGYVATETTAWSKVKDLYR